jgi:4-hydroxy-tetrahydrodipicolinate reductase
MSAMKLAIMGAAGRMGRELIRAVHATGGDAVVAGAIVAGAIERPGSNAVGQDAGELAGIGRIGVTVTDDPLDLVAKVDGILDFTVPEASVELAGLAANARIVHVIGTTGCTPAQDVAIKAAARHATSRLTPRLMLPALMIVAWRARCRLRHRGARDAP